MRAGDQAAADPAGAGAGPAVDLDRLRELDDHDLARAAAETTGARLLQARSEWLAAHAPESGPFTAVQTRALKDAGDLAGQRALVELLGAARPDDAVLSEEAPDDERRLAARRVWIVDPLDGTREFAEPGRDDWAVHVALCCDGGLVAGAVALPARGVSYGTAGAPASRAPAYDSASHGLRLAVSRSRPPQFVTELAGVLGAQLVPMGSAGVKAMSVLTGQADAYVHAGGQYEWDSAAPVAVARAHGLHTSRLDGSPLRYNRPDPLLPDLVIARPEVADELLAAIARLSG